MSDDEVVKAAREVATLNLEDNVHVTGDEGENCAFPGQAWTIKCLGHVGIARYDEEEYQGWVKLGVPTKVVNIQSGEILEFADVINTKLKHDDHVEVLCSMFSKEEKEQ